MLLDVRLDLLEPRGISHQLRGDREEPQGGAGPARTT